MATLFVQTEPTCGTAMRKASSHTSVTKPSILRAVRVLCRVGMEVFMGFLSTKWISNKGLALLGPETHVSSELMLMLMGFALAS